MHVKEGHYRRKFETCCHGSKHLKAGHLRPASETPFEWRFAGGSMVARHCMLLSKCCSPRRPKTSDKRCKTINYHTLNLFNGIMTMTRF